MLSLMPPATNRISCEFFANSLPNSIDALAGEQRAFQIAPEREAAQHPNGGGERHRHQKPDKAEQIAERKKREDQPDRMQADALADQLGRQDVAFEKLTDQKD